MAMIVQHYRKIKTGAGLKNVAAHNERSKAYDEKGNPIQNPQLVGPWLHPENKDWNFHSHKSEKGSVLERRSEGIKLANLSRRPQKNASYAIEANFTFSPDFCSDWATNPKSAKMVKAYFSDTLKFIKKKFGPENVLQVDVHFDEKTPHLHALLMPILTNAKGEKVYSSSSFLGGRTGLNKLQTEFANEVGKAYGLERGVEGSKARHTNQAEWSRDLKAKEKELAKREKVVEKAEEVIKQNPEGNVIKAISSRLYELNQAETNACWKAMEDKANEIRNARFQARNGEDQTRSKGRKS